MNSASLDTLECIGTYIRSEVFKEHVMYISKSILESSKDKKLIAICGNGGSAADSSHWTGELMCTYEEKSREAIGAVSLCENSSVITAWSNDFDYETVFARQVEGFKHNLGIVIGLSTSGSSPNVLKALNTAKQFGIKTIMITGIRCKVTDEYDLIVRVPSRTTSIVQTVTQILYHEVCSKIDELCVTH